MNTFFHTFDMQAKIRCFTNNDFLPSCTSDDCLLHWTNTRYDTQFLLAKIVGPIVVKTKLINHEA